MAGSLRRTGSAAQLLTVVAAPGATTRAMLEAWQHVGSCWQPVLGPYPARLGADGFSDHHREGDDTTPTGLYGIGPVVYGNAPDPGVAGPYHRLVCGDWWNEDPATPGYNTFEHVTCGAIPPFGGGSEALWTETAAYPSFAVIAYNTDPVVPGAGSAIFLHADTGTPTAGCVSIAPADLDDVLRWLRSADHPAVAMGSSDEMSDF